MDKEEQLQRLLRLKRHEQPQEGFTEEFLEKFQRRQRTELMRRSALGILWERTQAWMDGLRRPVVIWSAAAVYAAVLAGFWLVPRPAPKNPGLMVVVATGQEAGPSSIPVDYRGGGAGTRTTLPVQHTEKNGMPPGKRRTSGQSQNTEEVIGPVPAKPEAFPEPPLREL